MDNWNSFFGDFYEGYLALIKLDHAIAGIYIWETVFTVGFELEVLRGKRPYRWTIWLYLGTRCTGILNFILILVIEDGGVGEGSCRPISNVAFVTGFASWAFASLIIVLRVIAIWNLQRIFLLLSVFLWLAGLATIILTLITAKALYNPNHDTCTVLGDPTYRVAPVPVVALVVDIVLLISMLIGLLRYAHRSSTGIWYLLYQQCIIWIILTCIAGVLLVVFLIVNLNCASGTHACKNYDERSPCLIERFYEMFVHLALAIASIGAARMYRSLCQHASLTEFVTSELSHVSPGRSVSNAQYGAGDVHSTIHFAVSTESNNAVSTSEAPGFIPKDLVQLRFAPGASNPRLVHERSEDRVGYGLETA